MNKRPVRIARAHLGGMRGFTLAEALCATAIVGLAAAAILVSAASGSRANDAGRKLTEAVFLVQELREWTVQLPFDEDGVTDLGDISDVTYDPPLDGRGGTIAGMSGWSQTITVTWRNPQDLDAVVADNSSDTAYVEVAVNWQGDETLKTGWLVTRKE